MGGNPFPEARMGLRESRPRVGWAREVRQILELNSPRVEKGDTGL